VDAVSAPAAHDGKRDGNFADLIRAAQEDIAMGVDRAGWRDDPLRHPMAALSTTVGLFPTFLERMEAVAEQMRRPVTDDELHRLQAAIIHGADRRAADLARAHNLRTMLIYGGALAGAVLLALGGGFAWGRSSANAAVAQTERRLAAAFADGPDAAAAWVGLMEANDLPRALANCKGASAYADQAGRKVCAMPLYIEPLRRGG
jgi:hypothetical protein